MTGAVHTSGGGPSPASAGAERAATVALFGILVVTVAWWALALWPVTADAYEMTGQVWVIDGDTLQIEQSIVHLAGIDAPELGQRCLLEEKEWRCGLEAALALRKLVAFGGVVCTSEHVENGPGWRARLTIDVESRYRLRETFELAPPERELEVYFTNTWTRIPDLAD